MSISPTLAEICRTLPGVRMVRTEFEPLDTPAFAEIQAPLSDAVIVEGSSFQTKQISPSTESGFTHFVDGAQKTRLAYYEVELPGYLYFINAAVLHRIDGEMFEVSEEAAEGMALCAPDISRVAQTIRENEIMPVQLIPYQEIGMGMLAKCIADEISRRRNMLEQQMQVNWLRNNNTGYLLVDGGIGDIAKAAQNTNFAGLVKSHRKQYFVSREIVTAILTLPEACRTSVFRIESPHNDGAYSWYLRLRDDQNEAPDFGLVRVELPPIDALLERVDEISSWLLLETTPISLPDVRYDRLLYPIRRVEMYLKSKQPSDAQLQAQVGI